MDFKKNKGIKKAQLLYMCNNLKQPRSIFSSFLITDNVLKQLEEVRLKLNSPGDEHSLLLLLKMFSQILNHRTDALEPYHHCLKQLSQKLQHLPHADKEVFYIEVKRLVSLIKTRTN